MRILFAADELHFPDNVGGSRMDIHDLALTFGEQGHDVEVLAAASGRTRLLGYRALETVTGMRVLNRVDTLNGYPTTRCGSWQLLRSLGASVASRPPDLLITQSAGSGRLAGVASRQGVRAVIRLASAGEAEMLAAAARDDPEVGAVIQSPLVTLVAVSRFVATLAADLLGISPAVIYPPVRLQACVTPGREPDHITFINPIPLKGLEVALQVAQLLPQRRFVFVEAWNIPGPQRKALDHEMSKLPNVTFRPRSVGLADVYRSTAVLLAPSQCPEAFSRVVLEACANGIPVLASRVGGMPEAMGESGVLLAATDQPEHWAWAVEEILADRNRFAGLAASALANAQRPEFKMQSIAAEYLRLAGAAADSAAPR
jgi:glycosyltransferase involved in cell wall biosynthesis